MKAPFLRDVTQVWARRNINVCFQTDCRTCRRQSKHQIKLKLFGMNLCGVSPVWSPPDRMDVLFITSVTTSSWRTGLWDKLVYCDAWWEPADLFLLSSVCLFEQLKSPKSLLLKFLCNFPLYKTINKYKRHTSGFPRIISDACGRQNLTKTQSLFFCLKG